jgi:two-component system CheB/CheR fusion protein
MESILSSLNAAVVVINRDLIVQVWNREAEELWGLREEETIGAHFLNLDSGLPAEQLKPLIRDVMGASGAARGMTVDSINRRGRPVALRVTVTPLASGAEDPAGALLMIEQTGPDGNQGRPDTG